MMASEEFYMADVTAYRGWFPSRDEQGNPVLRSLVYNQAHWNPGLNTAQCLRNMSGYFMSYIVNKPEPHDPVQMKCDCGYWAYADPYHHESELLESAYFTESYVTGAVRLSGRVRVDERGFRATNAQVLALAPRRTVRKVRTYAGSKPTLGYPTIQELGQRFNVPVFGNFHAMVEAFPPTEVKTTPTRPDPYLLVLEQQHQNSAGAVVGYTSVRAFALPDGTVSVRCFTRDDREQNWRMVGELDDTEVKNLFRKETY